MLTFWEWNLRDKRISFQSGTHAEVMRFHAVFCSAVQKRLLSVHFYWRMCQGVEVQWMRITHRWQTCVNSIASLCRYLVLLSPVDSQCTENYRRTSCIVRPPLFRSPILVQNSIPLYSATPLFTNIKIHQNLKIQTVHPTLLILSLHLCPNQDLSSILPKVFSFQRLVKNNIHSSGIQFGGGVVPYKGCIRYEVIQYIVEKLVKFCLLV